MAVRGNGSVGMPELVTLHELHPSSYCYAVVQDLCNETPNFSKEMFGLAGVGREGASFFELLAEDQRAGQIALYEVVHGDTVKRSIGVVTLGSGYADGNYAYLHFLLLKRRFQGCGIGSEVLRLLEGLAAARADAMVLICDDEARIKNFWTRNGYQTIARIPLEEASPGRAARCCLRWTKALR